VLLAGDGWNNLQIARELGVDDETPDHWRRRWLQFAEVPLTEVSAAKRLSDAPKPDIATALQLFTLLNLIADDRISEPKRIEELYAILPEGKRLAIERGTSALWGLHRNLNK
jgi:hypothetical protein